MKITIKRLTDREINGRWNLPDGTNVYAVTDNGRDFLVTCRFHSHCSSLGLAGHQGTLHIDQMTGTVYRQVVALSGACGLNIDDVTVDGLSPWALRGVVIAEQSDCAAGVVLHGEDGGIPALFIDGAVTNLQEFGVGG